ncbi:hypothetical protein LSAT2_023948, partial [Lamellibrachia satsuma]
LSSMCIQHNDIYNTVVPTPCGPIWSDVNCDFLTFYNAFDPKTHMCIGGEVIVFDGTCCGIGEKCGRTGDLIDFRESPEASGRLSMYDKNGKTLSCETTQVSTEQVGVALALPKQHIPGWAAYNSLLNNAMPLTCINTSPLLAAAGHEWQRLLTILTQAQDISLKVIHMCCGGEIVEIVVTTTTEPITTTTCSDQPMCGGKPYDPTTHVCCSGKAFSSNLYMCCDGQIQGKPVQGACCGKIAYSRVSHHCINGQVITIGGEKINATISESGQHMCGTLQFDPAKSICCGGLVYPTNTYFCCDGQVQGKPIKPACCGRIAYSLLSHSCVGGIIVPAR